MYRIAPAAVALVLATSAGSPAAALILWQHTYDPAPGGLTLIDEAVSFAEPDRDLFVSVAGGLFESVSFEYYETYNRYWWNDNSSSDEADWYIDGNNYERFALADLIGGGKIAVLDASYPPDYFTCGAGPKVPWVDCGRIHTGGSAQFYGAAVLTDRRFTVTISDERPAAVPEPQAWALAIVGFGLTGAILRRRGSVKGQPAVE